jgi:hypothetical protein
MDGQSVPEAERVSGGLADIPGAGLPGDCPDHLPQKAIGAVNLVTEGRNGAGRGPTALSAAARFREATPASVGIPQRERGLWSI